MNKEKAIEALNTLITINNDRIEGYETASGESKEHDLKNFFGELLQTSHQCKSDLVAEVRRLGGTPNDDTKNTGKIFRIWMDVKAALTDKDRKAILNSCEFGEDIAKGTYEKVLEQQSEYLSNEQKDLIKTQYAHLKSDHNKVKSMRDGL
ncbi:MAG: PA2169 family four-helix-bundle protein [Bacteroidota bacterium]